MASGIPVYLEVGSKKVFACAVDWPGWARAAKDADTALDTLAEYAGRYENVATAAGVKLPAAARRGTFEVVERLKGDATTDFGAPGAIPRVDLDTPTPARWKKQLALLQGCWTVFGEVVAGAPARLGKGPRGGGRDRDQIATHVLEAEAAYARKVGLKPAPTKFSDRAAVAAAREELLERLTELRKTGPVTGPRGGKGWPAAYAVRRLAWHVTDHAWEIEDKSGG